MPRPKARTGAKARGRSKVIRTKKPMKKPKAKRRPRRQPKTSPENLRRELLKLKKSITGLQKTLADVPDKEVILPGGKDWKLWKFLCRKPSPYIVTQPLGGECFVVGKGGIGQPFGGECFVVGRRVTANLFKRGLGGIGLTMDFLIQLLEIPSRGAGKRLPRRR